MSSYSRLHCGLIAFAISIYVVLPGITADAQDATPKWEVFGGYSFLYPDSNVHIVFSGGILPVSGPVESNPRGAGASLTYNFSRWLGLTGDISGHWDGDESAAGDRLDDASFYNISVGPKLTYRTRHFSPFLEALVGGHRLTPDLAKRDDRFGFMAGAGLDVNLSRHFALRLIRGDYVFSNHHFGPDASVPTTELRSIRAQSGMVFMFGGHEEGPPVSANCAVNPSEVMSGEPLTATVTPNNFNSRHTLAYTWSSTGGKTNGHDTATTVDTNGTPGGSYTVNARVSDAGRKRDYEATCMATFTVKDLPRNPPAISCMAVPSTVPIGTSSSITCTCSSPDNSPVTVASWKASGGTLSGSGTTATLNTAGAPAGAITINASCSDARGLNSRTAAEVMVENPPPSPELAQLEGRLALHSIYFATARPTVKNPKKGLLESQQQTLLALADDFKRYLESKPDAHLTLEGHADPRASVKYNQALSERRVERARSFLIDHGIPAANIQTQAFGMQQNLTEAQVRDAVEQNPELTPEQRQRILEHLETVLLASNRRVDITLSTTGQQSVRQYPFNAADSLTLLSKSGSKRNKSKSEP